MMTWLYIATGFTGAWTLHFLIQQVVRLFITEPAIDVRITNGPGSLEPLLNALKKARREVKVLARTLHSPPVAQALIAAKARKVNVDILVDPACEREPASDLATLIEQGMMPQTVAPDAISMGAVIVIDGREVFCGGYSSGPDAGSDSTVDLLHFLGHPEVVASYQQHFKNEKTHARQSVVKTPSISPAPVGSGFKGYTTPGNNRSTGQPAPIETTRSTPLTTPTPNRTSNPTLSESPVPEKQTSLVGAGVDTDFEALKSSSPTRSLSQPPSSPRSLERSPDATPGAKSRPAVSGLTARSMNSSGKPSGDSSSQTSASPPRPYTPVTSDGPSELTEEEHAVEDAKRPLTPVEKTAQAAAALARLQNQSRPATPGVSKATSAPSPGQRSSSRSPANSSKTTPSGTSLANDPPVTRTAPVSEAPVTINRKSNNTPSPTIPASETTAEKQESEGTPNGESVPTTTTKPADNSSLTPLQRKLAALGINISNDSNGV